MPGFAGVGMVAVTVAVPPTGTSDGSGLRWPSHTTIVFARSAQW